MSYFRKIYFGEITEAPGTKAPSASGRGTMSIDVEATSSAVTGPDVEAPSMPSFRVKGNASAAFEGRGTVLGDRPEIFSFMVSDYVPQNFPLEKAVSEEFSQAGLHSVLKLRLSKDGMLWFKEQLLRCLSL